MIDISNMLGNGYAERLEIMRAEYIKYKNPPKPKTVSQEKILNLYSEDKVFAKRVNEVYQAWQESEAIKTYEETIIDVSGQNATFKLAISENQSIVFSLLSALKGIDIIQMQKATNNFEDIDSIESRIFFIAKMLSIKPFQHQTTFAEMLNVKVNEQSIIDSKLIEAIKNTPKDTAELEKMTKEEKNIGLFQEDYSQHTLLILSQVLLHYYGFQTTYKELLNLKNLKKK